MYTILGVIAEPLGWLLSFLYGFINNYGITIIIFTIITTATGGSSKRYGIAWNLRACGNMPAIKTRTTRNQPSKRHTPTRETFITAWIVSAARNTFTTV